MSMLLHVLDDMLHAVKKISFTGEIRDCVVPLVFSGVTLTDNLVEPSGGEIFTRGPALVTEFVLHGKDVSVIISLLDQMLEGVDSAHILLPIRSQDIFPLRTASGCPNLPSRGNRVILLPILSPLCGLLAQTDLELFYLFYVLLFVGFPVGQHEVYRSFIGLKNSSLR